MASLGQALREEREARNISIEEIASATKIVPRYLEALENDRLDIMPGEFFIKGIIRTYARSIGLDGDEVLARYRAAGLVGEPERKRHSFLKPAPEPAPAAAPLPQPASPPPAPKIPPAAELAAPAPPAEPVASAETAPSPPPKAAPELLIEEAPKPKLSPEARKRIIAWAWRIGAAALAVAVIILLWPSGKRKPAQAGSETDASGPGTVVSQSVLPPAQKTEPISAPASEPSVKPEPPPGAEEIWKGITIEISFHAETWIQVYTDGVLKVDGLFPAGATARAQADERLLIHVGNAGGFSFLLNGKPAKPLGRSGQVMTDIKITLENYKDFLEGQAPGQPAG